MNKTTIKTGLRASTLSLVIILTSITNSMIATPAQQQPIIIYQTNQGMGTFKKLVWSTAIISAGVLYVDVNYFGGNLVWHRIRNRLFGDIDARLAELQTQVNAVQAGVDANGNRIEAVHTEVKGVKGVVDNHTGTLADHTGRLTTVQTGIQANGNAIAAARNDVQGVRTVVDRHTGQLNDHTKQIKTVDDGIQATRSDVQGVRTAVEGHTQTLSQLRDGQTATLAGMDRLENALNAQGNSSIARFLNLQLVTTVPQTGPMTTGSNVHVLRHN